MVLFLFLTHLAIGIVFTLALVSREAGVKFFRFNAGLAAILIAVAFAFRRIDDISLLGRTALAAGHGKAGTDRLNLIGPPQVGQGGLFQDIPCLFGKQFSAT